MGYYIIRVVVEGRQMFIAGRSGNLEPTFNKDEALKFQNKTDALAVQSTLPPGIISMVISSKGVEIQ